MYAEVPTDTTAPSVPFSSSCRKSPQPVFVFTIQCLWFVLCYFPHFIVRSDQDSAACLVWQATPLNSRVMSNLPYKLQWLWGSPPPHSPCLVRVSYLSKWWRSKSLVLNRKTFSGHLLCPNSSTLNPPSQLKMEGLWLIQLVWKMAGAWLPLNIACSAHTDSEHQLERSDSKLDLSLRIACGKGELAFYNSTWTCFNLSLSSLEGGIVH